MKQKKKHEHNNESSKTSGQAINHDHQHENEAEDRVETAEALVEEAKEDKVAEEMATLQQKYDEVNDKYLRLYSEFDNYRKRALKEKIELSKTASEQVLVEMLTVLDDLERAIASFETAQTVEPLKEGTMLIYNKLKNNLAQKGLLEIDAKGQPFNTDYHEAIANVPAASEDQKNKIMDVTQKGYTLNGKVIRFAKVVVNS